MKKGFSLFDILLILVAGLIIGGVAVFYINNLSAGTFDQTVNEPIKEKVAESGDAGALDKIRVQEIGDRLIDWGEGRSGLYVNNYYPFGNIDTTIQLGFVDNGQIVWRPVDKDGMPIQDPETSEKVKEIANDLKNEKN